MSRFANVTHKYSNELTFSQANPKYISINWEASGGGAFAVIPIDERGKLPDQVPLFRGHTAAVLDTDWLVKQAISKVELIKL